MSGPVVAIDTSILICAERAMRSGTDAVGDDARCLELINKLTEDGATVVIPATVVAEYVAGGKVPPTEEEIAVLTGEFQVAPMDAKAAHLAGRFVRERRQAAAEGRPMTERTRGEVKADIEIIAVADGAGASILYTTDANMYLPPSAKVELRTPPVFSRPTKLFDAAGDRPRPTPTPTKPPLQ